MVLLKLSTSSLLLSLSSTAQAINYPVGISNCHYSQWFQKAPERVAVASSGAVEIMLTMGLVDRIVSTSWVKEVWEPLSDDFSKVQRYDKYPSAKELMDSKPDMIYATYSSAFEDPADPSRVEDGGRLNYTEALGLEEPCNVLIPSNSYGENKTYCRDEIHAAGIDTYLAESYCEYSEYRPGEVSVDALYQEVWDIAMIFDAVENARSMVDGIESHFEQALAISQASGNNAEADEPISVLWLDSFLSKSKPDEKRPFIGACCGGPQIVLEKAGAVNVFEKRGLEDRRIWDRIEWDEIVPTDPDLIVLIDLTTESAAEKLYHLCSDPVLREMRAVKERQFLTMPFAASNVGVRLGAAAYNMAEAISALARGKPLNALEFTEDPETAEAVSLSGLKVWTTLPTWNGTNLETYCPGSSKKIDIRVVSDAEERGLETDEKLATWAIVLICVFGAVALFMSIFLMTVVRKEKAGNPMFKPILNNAGETA